MSQQALQDIMEAQRRQGIEEKERDRTEKIGSLHHPIQ